jgi:hypothetical protein
VRFITDKIDDRLSLLSVTIKIDDISSIVFVKAIKFLTNNGIIVFF